MKKLLLLIPLLLLAGCATPRQTVFPRGYCGDVVEQKWLTDDTLHLVYESAPGVVHGHGEGLAQLNMAEAALARGWTTIMSYDVSWERESFSYTLPGRSSTVAWGRGSATGRDDRADVQAFAHGTTTHTPAREMTGYTRLTTVRATFGHGGDIQIQDIADDVNQHYGW